jgi:Putative zinc-finger
MSHLDEGTLHALLDGELETHEVAEIQAHLGSCSSCGLRLREVKEFYAEADRLIASVDLEATAPASAARLTPVPAGPQPEQSSRREPTPRPQPAVAPSKWEPWNEPPPVLLVPDNESAAERRIRRMRRLGWAAILVVIVGAGAVEAKKFLPVTAEDVPPASNAKTVVSQEEAPARDAGSVAPAPLAKRDSAAAAGRALATKPPAAPRETKPAAPTSKALAAATGSVRKENRKDARASDETATDQLNDSATDQPVANQAADSPAADSQAVDSQAGGEAEKAEADTAGATDLATVRQRAAEALADLDRERRLKQAAAATAALDASKRKPTAARAAAPAVVQPAAAPAPPTLEQRAQIYLRIGLDEASRQLGGPAHVIEGLSPVFMGLAQGTSVAGADATRPVVRVVYQDSQGRLILLDQQRLRAGQALPPAGPLSWTIGGTVMWLHGEAGPDILRTYRSRVR